MTGTVPASRRDTDTSVRNVLDDDYVTGRLSGRGCRTIIIYVFRVVGRLNATGPSCFYVQKKKKKHNKRVFTRILFVKSYRRVTTTTTTTTPVVVSMRVTR